jgi:hypothetical protein
MQVAALGNGFLGPGNAELGSYVRHIPVRAVEEWDRGGRKAAETNTVMAGHQMQDGARSTACCTKPFQPLNVGHRKMQQITGLGSLSRWP